MSVGEGDMCGGQQCATRYPTLDNAAAVRAANVKFLYSSDSVVYRWAFIDMLYHRTWDFVSISAGC